MIYLNLIILSFFVFPIYCEASCNEEQLSRQKLLTDVLSDRATGDLVEAKKSFQFGFERLDGKLRFDSLFIPDATNEVSFTYLKSKVSGPRPTAIILSPLGGTNPIDGWIALNLARYGISSVTSYYQSSEAGSTLGDAFRDTGDNMQAQMTLTDWLVEQPEVDSEQIAILGISFGGIRSSFLMGIDERLKKAVLVVSGGGLADIMASSQLADVVKIREKHMQKSIPSIREYKKVFKEAQRVTMWIFWHA